MVYPLARQRNSPANSPRSILIGADCPTLEADQIRAGRRAAQDARRRSRSRRDGGYYLIGLRGPWNSHRTGFESHLPRYSVEYRQSSGYHTMAAGIRRPVVRRVRDSRGCRHRRRAQSPARVHCGSRRSACRAEARNRPNPRRRIPVRPNIPMKKEHHATIVGGGVIGLSIAWELARRGVRVTLLERSQIGRATSWAGAGILPPANLNKATDPIDQLRGLSHSLFPQWTEELESITGHQLRVPPLRRMVSGRHAGRTGCDAGDDGLLGRTRNRM